MKRRNYTDYEMRLLLSNPFIKEIKNKRMIIFHNDFKLWAVKKKIKFPEMTCKEIFKEAKIDVSILHDRLPDQRIKEWKKAYLKFGVEYFDPNCSKYETKFNEE